MIMGGVYNYSTHRNHNGCCTALRAVVGVLRFHPLWDETTMSHPNETLRTACSTLCTN